MSANPFGPAGTDTDRAARQAKQDLKRACRMYNDLWERAQETGHILDIQQANKECRSVESELDNMRSLM